MTETEKNLLQELYSMNASRQTISMGEFETLTGLSGFTLRVSIETLKEEGFIVERYADTFEITEKGIDYARSIWA